MKLCVIIPTYNHGDALAGIVSVIRVHNLPILIIDDGSADSYRAQFITLAAQYADVDLLHLPVNGGKGAAVMTGFKHAAQAGYTHALQIDADGQHDLGALSAMLAIAASNPDALVTGVPIYDESIPMGRKIGRWITHVWVWVETLSFQIRDSMCGFRIYPLAPVLRLIDDEPIGRRMDFDTDIMVRLFWRGVKVIGVPVKVIYPPGNTSNFDMLRDNIRITAMHTRLVFTMLKRQLFRRRQGIPHHWADMGERGTYLGLKICIKTYSLLGRRFCQVLLGPVVLYFYLVGQQQRRAAQDFLTRALGNKPTFAQGYRLFWSFAMRALDNLAAWHGDLKTDAIRSETFPLLKSLFDRPRGGVLVTSHLGNSDVARALIDPDKKDRLVILVHTKNALNYQKALQSLVPDSALNMIQVTDMGPETIIDLQQRLEQGAWIVIAGDRPPVLSEGRIARVPFLGQDAPFAQGPWILASLLNCPVYLLFCLSKSGHYELTVEEFAAQITLPRNQREEVLRAYAERYAARLEFFARRAPYQWFNFFDFWPHT